jgi:hypothetical protein
VGGAPPPLGWAAAGAADRSTTSVMMIRFMASS